MSDPARLAAAGAVLAPALSGGRRREVRPVSGTTAAFATDLARVYVPHPPPAHPEVPPLAHVTAGIALQASPTKEAVAALPLAELDTATRRALQIVEGDAALTWVGRHWPGLTHDLLVLSGRPASGVDPDVAGAALLDRAVALARSGRVPEVPPIFGLLPGSRPLSTTVPWTTRLRARSRLPWSRREVKARMRDSVPVGGSGGEESPRAGAPDTKEPPAEEPSRDDRRFGVMYPEWDAYAGRYRTEWVAVLERRMSPTAGALARPDPEILRWFRQAPSRTWHDGLEDGTDLDVAAFIDRYCRQATGEPTDDRVYAALGPGRRDVATAVLLDASSSLQVGGGRAFDLELACADALVAAMGATGERFAVFAFTGETRHRVEVAVLRDFDDPLGPIPRGPSLRPTGYTRLGAPLRHATRRLLDTPAERRVLLSIGDGLPSDEGYEGRYAEADVARAVAEATEAGVVVQHVGVGRVGRDPLPRCFGAARSVRITSVGDLPAVLGRVHEELIDE
jgi:nitric oxide reductase NorD protein